jgi:uncharacterized iron-regulated protein
VHRVIKESMRTAISATLFFARAVSLGLCLGVGPGLGWGFSLGKAWARDLENSSRHESSTTQSASTDVWNGRIYDVQARRFLLEKEAREAFSKIQVLVLGEKHDTPQVQLQQSRALEWAVESKGFGPADRWVLGWEFLNRKDQAAIDGAWARFRQGQISGTLLLDDLQGKGRSRSYLPILNAGLRFGGELLGTNLSRQEKAPVVAGGIASLDPSVIGAIVPPGFALGGPGYRERFETAMGEGHATPDQMERYFEAQCLTDDVIAYELLKPSVSFRALVVGSFHSDYNDGVVRRLRVRAPDQRIHVIRFVDASEYLLEELDPDLVLREPIRHKRYGDLADWVWFAGEPRPN